MHRSYRPKAIRPEMTVRQIATDFPATRQVFSRYGLREARPGVFGHLEPVSGFARRHGIPLDRLLEELGEATGAPIDRHHPFADRVHRAFLLAGLGITLSLGAGWGGWLLHEIAVSADFQAASSAQVIAHGEAQLWGFIGLFVMGVSLRTALQGAVRRRWGRGASRALWVLAIGGIAGGWIWSLRPDRLPGLGVASAAALLAMALVYVAVQLAIVGPKWRSTWGRAVLLSGLWLVVWAWVTLQWRHGAGSLGPAAYTDGQRLVLIELAVFGFAINTIYGFGQMLLPGLLRLGTPRGWALEAALLLHNAGTVLLVALASGAGEAAVPLAGSTLLVAGAVAYCIGLRALIGKARSSYRAEQGHWALDYYVPLAFFWLVASLALLALGYAYQVVASTPLPHAYLGAVRHALTVGFMTTLILGVGQRLVPVLEHRVLALPSLVIPTLLLIGTGNLLRVGSEFAVLAWPGAFLAMPVSALLEWTALLLFTINVARTMFQPDPLRGGGRVTGKTSLAVLLARVPQLEDRLIATGSDYLARTRSVPAELTVAAFAASEGRDPGRLIAEINAILAGRE